MLQQFDKLPDESKLWIFPLLRRIDQEQEQRLSLLLSDFVESWKAHGAEVSGGFLIYDQQFIIVAADKFSAEISGCSIDSLFKAVSSAAEDLNLEIAEPSIIFYRGSEEIIAETRGNFRESISNGEISQETVVFDNSIQSLAEFRNYGFEKQLKNSWHQKAFVKVV